MCSSQETNWNCTKHWRLICFSVPLVHRLLITFACFLSNIVSCLQLGHRTFVSFSSLISLTKYHRNHRDLHHHHYHPRFHHRHRHHQNQNHHYHRHHHHYMDWFCWRHLSRFPAWLVIRQTQTSLQIITTLFIIIITIITIITIIIEFSHFSDWRITSELISDLDIVDQIAIRIVFGIAIRIAFIIFIMSCIVS